MQLVSNTAEGIVRALDALTARQGAIANNIANINTPGYARQEVQFEASLREALDSANVPKPESDVGQMPAMFDGMPVGGGGGMMGGASVTDASADVLLTWQPRVTQATDGPQRLDGNHTPLESEMSGMAMNNLRFNALTTVVAKEFSMLKTIAQAR